MVHWTYFHFVYVLSVWLSYIQNGAKRSHVFEIGSSRECEGWRPHGRNGRNVVPTRWSHSPHGKGFDGSCSTNVSATRSLAFRWCPLAPTLTIFICLRFLSLAVTSNQKSTFENLVQSTNWKFPFAKKLQTVPQDMLVNVMRNFEERLRTCVRQEGRHLSDIIFRNWVISVTVTSTHVEPEQYITWSKSTISRKLLKMDVLTFETCWATH